MRAPRAISALQKCVLVLSYNSSDYSDNADPFISCIADCFALDFLPVKFNGLLNLRHYRQCDQDGQGGKGASNKEGYS